MDRQIQNRVCLHRGVLATFSQSRLLKYLQVFFYLNHRGILTTFSMDFHNSQSRLLTSVRTYVI